MSSISVDDRRGFETAPVDHGFEDQRVFSTLDDPVIQLAIDNELHRFTAEGAGGSDLDFEGALPQLPLHEGRRNRVFSSSSVQAFAGAEDEVLRGLIDGCRKGPRDLRTIPAREEEQVPLEILHDLVGSLSRQSQSLRDPAD